MEAKDLIGGRSQTVGETCFLFLKNSNSEIFLIFGFKFIGKNVSAISSLNVFRRTHCSGDRGPEARGWTSFRLVFLPFFLPSQPWLRANLLCVFRQSFSLSELQFPYLRMKR